MNRVWIVGLGAFLLSSPAAGQDGAVDRGRTLALQTCSGCHFVVHGQRRPAAVQAPTFAAIAASPTASETSLSNFLRTPHPIMPMLILTADETRDVVAYILSLKGR
jgi:mono/diheme cytochrome c family protein